MAGHWTGAAPYANTVWEAEPRKKIAKKKEKRGDEQMLVHLDKNRVIFYNETRGQFRAFEGGEGAQGQVAREKGHTLMQGEGDLGRINRERGHIDKLALEIFQLRGKFFLLCEDTWSIYFWGRS